MKKYLWLSIVFSSFLLLGGWIFINSTLIPNQVYKQKSYLVVVKGAVYNKMESWILEGTKLKTVIYKAHLLVSADLSKLDLDKKINKDQEIFVPYKEGQEPKINARDGLSYAEIDQLGVNKNVAKALFKLFKEKHNHVTWDDIDNLPGVGEVTLARLKKLLII